MSKPRLSNRLQAIFDMVDPGAYLADVGSDHALLPIALVQSGKISWAQAIENKVGPFLHMQNAISAAGLVSHISSSRSDGISKLNPSVDEIAICGMGGMLACDILEAHPEKLSSIKAIILDPHRDLMAARKRVCDLGFHIEDETMVFEDKIYYTIIKFAAGEPKKPYSQPDLAFGPKLRRKAGPVYLDWLNAQLKTLNDLLNKPISKERRDSVVPWYRLVRDERNRVLRQSESK
ncbi:MAG: SAM-dependent methyltransferase [Bacilli bacterium]|nr:SAM-dependent methyltransferase [Bacilli bacterium]